MCTSVCTKLRWGGMLGVCAAQWRCDMATWCNNVALRVRTMGVTSRSFGQHTVTYMINLDTHAATGDAASAQDVGVLNELSYHF
jgi:hypothetical protein